MERGGGAKKETVRKSCSTFTSVHQANQGQEAGDIPHGSREEKGNGRRKKQATNTDMGPAHIWDDGERLVTKKSFADRVWDAIKPVWVDWCEGESKRPGPQRQPGKRSGRDSYCKWKRGEGEGAGGSQTLHSRGRK